MFPKYLTYFQTYFFLLKTKDDILNNISLIPNDLSFGSTQWLTPSFLHKAAVWLQCTSCTVLGGFKVLFLWTLNSSVLVYCNCMDKSNQHSFQNLSLSCCMGFKLNGLSVMIEMLFVWHLSLVDACTYSCSSSRLFDSASSKAERFTTDLGEQPIKLSHIYYQ